MTLTFKEIGFACDSCGFTSRRLHWLHEPAPRCPNDGRGMTPVDDRPAQAHGVIPDGIPGGIEIRHGLCNADGSARRYDSKTDIRREARRRGFTISGETPGAGECRWI